MPFKIVPLPDQYPQFFDTLREAEVLESCFIVDRENLELLQNTSLKFLVWNLRETEGSGTEILKGWSNFCATPLALIMERLQGIFPEKEFRLQVLSGGGENSYHIEVEGERKTFLDLSSVTLSNLWSARSWSETESLLSKPTERALRSFGVVRRDSQLCWENTRNPLFQSGGLVNPWGMGLHPWPRLIDVIEAITQDRNSNPWLYRKPEDF